VQGARSAMKIRIVLAAGLLAPRPADDPPVIDHARPLHDPREDLLRSGLRRQPRHRPRLPAGRRGLLPVRGHGVQRREHCGTIPARAREVRRVLRPAVDTSSSPPARARQHQREVRGACPPSRRTPRRPRGPRCSPPTEAGHERTGSCRRESRLCPRYRASRLPPRRRRPACLLLSPRRPCRRPALEVSEP
jgi:hypothetical protein